MVTIGYARLVEHVLSHSATLPNGAVMPVSAVILKNIPDYLSVLMGFSQPVTQFREYVRGESEPIVTRAAPGPAYRFMDLSREIAFLHGMIRLAVEDEIPRELGWLADTIAPLVNSRRNLTFPAVTSRRLSG